MLEKLPPHIRAKISPEPNTGCWLWDGHIDKDGYGDIRWRGKTNARAHRIVMVMAGNVYPPGFETDHLCKVRSCVNPDHLEIVTAAENQRRVSAEKRFSAVAWRRNQTHCVNGHEFTKENTYLRLRGGRDCRACKCAREQKRRRAA